MSFTRSVMRGWCGSIAIAKAVQRIAAAGGGKCCVILGQHWSVGDQQFHKEIFGYMFEEGLGWRWRYFNPDNENESTCSVHEQGTSAEVACSIMENLAHRLVKDTWIWLQWIEINGVREEKDVTSPDAAWGELAQVARELAQPPVTPTAKEPDKPN